MSEEEETVPETEATAGWLAVAGAVADGRLAPQAGIERLRDLQAQYPEESEWLEEEVQTIRWTFGMDVEELVSGGDGSYWEKALSVTEGLLDERITPSQAVVLLTRVREQFPDQRVDAQKLIDDIAHSPLWQLMDGT